MSTADHNMHEEMSRSRSVALVSAGRLIAGVSRINRSSTQAEYQFTVADVDDPVTTDSEFCLCDLLHLIKLVQLVASEVVNDGCAAVGDQVWLRRAVTHLDQLLEEIANSHTPSCAAHFAESEPNSRKLDDGFEADS